MTDMDTFRQATAHSANNVTMAEIVGVYGVKGWVKIKSWAEPRERIFTYAPWSLLDKNGRSLADYQFDKGEKRGRVLVAKLHQCDDRETAAKLRGVTIEVSRESLPELADREYYWTDIIGSSVTNQQGVMFGTVTDLMDTGANDVLVIDGDQRRMVPFVLDRYVIDIDITGKQIVVDWDADFDAH